MSHSSTPLLFLKGDEIVQLLQNREKQILDAVGAAYQAHALQDTRMPPNSYLRFPGKEKERIIAKAAWLGGAFNQAGIKWIASFPGNIANNLERASATLILNSTETGHPTAVMESSVISANRTAASAALAARKMYPEDDLKSVGLIGCGLINFETLRYILALFEGVDTVTVFDLSEARAEQFGKRPKP